MLNIVQHLFLLQIEEILYDVDFWDVNPVVLINALFIREYVAPLMIKKKLFRSSTLTLNKKR